MIPTISQVCSLHSPFAQDVEDLAAGHCRSMEVWLTKLETFLEQRSLDEVRSLLVDCDMHVPAASFQGGLLTHADQRRREADALFRRRLELCHELNIGTLVVACDVAPPVDASLVQQILGWLREAAETAAAFQVRLALEFQARAAFGNNVQTAVAIVREVGQPNLGICLDAFHFAVGPSKSQDLCLLTTDNLFHVQLCDIADRPREFASDSDRILPGDGDLPLEVLIEYLKQIDYRGPVSLELMNPQLWQVPALQVGEIGMTCLRKLLGQAE